MVAERTLTMAEIPISTDTYEQQFGKPAGRAFWSFRIISDSTAITDHVFTTRKRVTFPEACRRARELARLLRSERIVLMRDSGRR
jgi:hypothetical protein